MNGPQRTPPRFVPTLTTVLELPPEPAPEPATDAQGGPENSDQHVVIDSSHAIALDPQAKLSEVDAFRLEEQLLHRVLQRVDLSLEERLSDAVSAAVQQQLDTMIPRLRGEVEAVLRALVSEALARELSDATGSTPAVGAQTLG